MSTTPAIDSFQTGFALRPDLLVEAADPMRRTGRGA